MPTNKDIDNLLDPNHPDYWLNPTEEELKNMKTYEVTDEQLKNASKPNWTRKRKGKHE